MFPPPLPPSPPSEAPSNPLPPSEAPSHPPPSPPPSEAPSDPLPPSEGTSDPLPPSEGTSDPPPLPSEALPPSEGTSYLLPPPPSEGPSDPLPSPVFRKFDYIMSDSDSSSDHEPSVKKQKVNEEEDAEAEKPQLPSKESESDSDYDSDSSKSKDVLTDPDEEEEEDSSDFETLDPLPMDGSMDAVELGEIRHAPRPKGVVYFPNPGDRECWNKYAKQIKESEGFDIKDYPKSVPFRSIYPMRWYLDRPDNVKLMEDYASQVLEKYNKENGTTYEVDKIIKLNGEGCRDTITI